MKAVQEGLPKVRLDAWPIVLIEFPEALDDGAISLLRSAFADMFDRNEKYAVIVDTGRIRHVPNAQWRRAAVAWLNDPAFLEQHARYNVGSANLIHSAPLRGALTAIQWLWKPPTPQYYPRDLLEAADWCIARLREHGVEPGSAVNQLRSRLAAEA